MSSEWETARGESMNYVNEIKATLSSYSYADSRDAAATHKELCRVLQARLGKAAENAHLASDFLRGPRTAELERAMRNLKDDVEIFRDEVGSSYVDWKSPKSNVIREIIDKDVQIIRNSATMVRLSDQLREAAINSSAGVMLEKATEANDLLSKVTYIFSDRERLCR